MKLTVLMFGFLHVSFVSAGLFSLNDLQPAGSSLSRGSRAQVPDTAEPVNPKKGRKRPLFARRGQCERQRVQVPKERPKKVPLNDLAPPPDSVLKPTTQKCSQLTQSCMPQSGCCDAGATCHCRFFNAICFCRRMSSRPKT
ncbi:agouti-related protein-like [Labrus bergylta]|uniref:agouti-related protein-like n=1 Tax=Labrus bergylta TaxID=56723 RepID=UPI003313C977